jgi:ABC-type branched-subunit amino acid transport system substrate-binding protein
MNQVGFYQVGGDLRFQHPSYVKRQADEDLYHALKTGEFCYVFKSRQMGKSSLGIQISQRLKDDGYACCFINLAAIGSEGTAEEWYFSIADQIARKLKISNNLTAWWNKQENLPPLGRFSKFIETVLLKEIEQDIVIFIDEIDSIRRLKKFSADDFFALIRTCYNNRVDQPAYQHLTFALFGVATPSNLIQNENCTPFNIGKAIELRGFQEHEVDPLAQGLSKENFNPQAILREVLAWTGGQPFLTQKLCRLVIESTEFLPVEDEATLVRTLAIEKIIKKWEDQDNPEHLATISKRLLSNEKLVRRKLMLCQQILQNQEIILTDSPEQWELRLSGLVDNQSGKLKVYNRIYAQVFNLEWLSQKLSELSPFADRMLEWKASKFTDQSQLLQGQALVKGLEWSKDKYLSNLGEQFLGASRDLKNERRIRQVLLAAAVFFVLIGGIFSSISRTDKLIYDQYASCTVEKGTVGEKIGDVCFRTLITSGEKKAFVSIQNSSLDKGTEFFKKGAYKEAKKLFDQARESDPSDPVPLIFSNNAQARLQGNPLKIAVVAAIDNNEEAAKAILRGVAEAQYKFNSKYGKNKDHDFLLEIVISNDGNQEKVAEKVAKDLASKTDILGIIGHQTSESVKEANKVYGKKETQVAVISPTSTSSKLTGDAFFRTVDSTEAAATALTKLIRSLDKDKLAVVYKPNSEYSNTLKDDFEKETGKVALPIELKDNEIIDIEEEIRDITKKNIRAVLLISSLQTNSVALAIARAVARKNEKLKLPLDQKLHLIGADALFERTTLEKGADAVEGVTLVSPCLSLQSDYTQNAAKRWELKPQEIDWRTASSYDATQAFITAIKSSKERTRVEILKELGSLTLPVKETSGFGLEWGKDPSKGSYHSNVKRKYCIFRIQNNKFEEIKLPKINN